MAANNPPHVNFNINSREDEYALHYANRIGLRMAELFPCSRCGNCCDQDFIIISDGDLERIANFLNMTWREFREKYLKRIKGDWYLKENSPCSFFDNGKKLCTIYQVRPTSCRQFPYQSPWFVEGIFNMLKFGPKNCPPFAVRMGEDWPCRKDLKKRILDVIKELSDESQ